MVQHPRRYLKARGVLWVLACAGAGSLDVILALWITSSLGEVGGGLVHEAVVAKAKMLLAMAKVVLAAGFVLCA